MKDIQLTSHRLARAGGALMNMLGYNWEQNSNAESGNQYLWWEKSNLASFFYNPFGIKETEQNEWRERFINPLGILTARYFTDKVTGSGSINIIHDDISNKISVDEEAELGVGSISIGSEGFKISVGIRNSIEIGFTQGGIMVGLISRRNNVVFGTEYSWRPSLLWYSLASAPIKVSQPTLSY